MQKIRKLLPLQRQQHVDDSTRTLFARMQVESRMSRRSLPLQGPPEQGYLANHHASSSLSQLNAYEHDLKLDTHTGQNMADTFVIIT